MEIKNETSLQSPLKILKKEYDSTISGKGFATPTFKVEKMPIKPPQIRTQVCKGSFVSFSDLASMKDRYVGIIRTQTFERKPGRRSRKTRKKPSTTPNKMSFLHGKSSLHGISSFHSFNVTAETNHQLQQIMQENKNFINRRHQGGVTLKSLRTPPNLGLRKPQLHFSEASALQRPQMHLHRQLHKHKAPGRKSIVQTSRIMKQPRGKYRPNILRNTRMRRALRKSPIKKKLLKKLRNSPRKALDFSPSKFFNQSKSSLLNSSSDSKSSQSHVKSLFKESFEEDPDKNKEFSQNEFIKFCDSGICLQAQDDMDDFDIHDQNSIINPSLTSTPISEKRNKNKTRVGGVQPFSFQVPIENIPFENTLNDSAQDIELLLDPNRSISSAEQKTDDNFQMYRMMDCSLFSNTEDESSGLLATTEEDYNLVSSQNCNSANNTGHEVNDFPVDLYDVNLYPLECPEMDLSEELQIVSASQNTELDSRTLGESFFSEEIDPLLSSSSIIESTPNSEPVLMTKLTLSEPTPTQSSSLKVASSFLRCQNNENFIAPTGISLRYEQREIKKSQHISLLGDAGNTTPHASPVKSYTPSPMRIKLTARFVEVACGCSEDQKQMTRAARNFMEMNPRVQAV